MSQTTNQTLSLILFGRCFKKRWDVTCPSGNLEYRLIYISGKKTPSTLELSCQIKGSPHISSPSIIQLVGHPHETPTLW